jgi:hypothetical protein
MKKILLTLLVLLIAAAGILVLLNGKDTYDASKYSANLSNGLQKGSKISFTLPDQFDKSHTLTDSITTLIYVSAKATGHTVKEFLKSQPADYLEKHHALFVADISPMPVIIRNTFALPDLKKQHYSVLLIYDKTFSEEFKKGTEKDKIMIISLKNGKVEKVAAVEDAKALESALK